MVWAPPAKWQRPTPRPLKWGLLGRIHQCQHNQRNRFRKMGGALYFIKNQVISTLENGMVGKALLSICKIEGNDRNCGNILYI